MVQSGSGRVRLVSATAVATALATALLVGNVRSTSHTVITFPDFSDTSSLQLNGDAAAQNPAGQSFLRLTSGLNKAGSAFSTAPVTLAADAAFSTSFAFQITAPVGSTDGADGVQGADGITFVVQTQSNTAGGLGGGIGYGGDGSTPGILNSVAVEFDTWNNGLPDDNNGNHVGVDTDGSIDSIGSVTPVSPAFNDGSVWYAWIDYNGLTDLLEIRVSQINVRPVTATTSVTLDLPAELGSPNAFVGFTSGTGGAGGNHDILSWTFINAFNPVGLNAAPTAAAGPDQSVTQTTGPTSVTLNGAGSTDPDGDNLTYAWTGPFVEATATGPNPIVSFAGPGTYTITLTVSDGNGGVDTDEVVITVAARPPTTASPTATPSALPDTAVAATELPPSALAAMVLVAFASGAALAGTSPTAETG